jgi:hypothetical protein
MSQEVDTSAAFVQVPPAPEPEEFVVVGTTSVDGHSPGQRFTAVIPEERVSLLLQGGHIERVQEIAENASKADLVDRAKALGIKGGSAMNKEELAAVVAETEAQQTQQTQQSQQVQDKSALAQDDKE